MKTGHVETQSPMHDRNGNTLKAGDIITATVANEGKPSGAKWEVLGIGIEPSTDMRICCIQEAEDGFIVCCYQSELMFFDKVETA